MAAIIKASLMALLQRPRLIIAATLAALIIFVSYSTPTEEIKTRAQQFIQSKPYTFRGQAVHLRAHNFSDADDFLPHFRAVVEYPSMPISDSKAGCGWADESLVNLQWSYDESRGDDFKWIIEDEDDYKLELIRRQWQYFIANELRPWGDYKKKFKGRGIVIPAGHEKSVHRVKVILKMLKKLGSELPVEIAYWEGKELPQETKEELKELWPEIHFNDLSRPDQPVPTYYSPIRNFHLKIPAVINARFEEVLLLDSDNIPVIDPAVLFESETYKEYGTVFWPDIVRTRPQNPIWAITNTQCKMDEWEQESGQLLVDKRRFFYHLQLATWFENEHALYYEHLILGDKDFFRFAWHALKTQYGKPTRWITSVGTNSPGEEGKNEKFYCGHTFAQHHPDAAGKVAFLHGGLLKTLHPSVIEWQLEHQGGLFQTYKRANSDENPLIQPPVEVVWDPAHYLQPKPADYILAWCTNIKNEPARPLDEIVPGFQQTYKDIGGYWMIGK